MLGALKRLCEQGITVLIVEQNVHSALWVARRVYIFETGRIVAENGAGSIRNGPDLMRAYLGA